MSHANQFISCISNRSLFRTLMVTSVTVFVIHKNDSVITLYGDLQGKDYKSSLTPPFVITYQNDVRLPVDVHPRCCPSTSGTYLWFVPRWPLQTWIQR